MKRICLAILLGAVVLFTGCKQNDIVATVGGHPLVLQEYRQYAYDSIALTAAEYSRTYGVDPNSQDFWSTKWQGKTPLDSVLEQADQIAKRSKGMQAIAVDMGLLSAQQISWQGQQQAFETENETRRKTLQQGGVVYGPQQLTQAQFSSYWQSAVDQLVEDALYQQAQPTQQQLQQYYNEHKEELSARNFTAQVDFYSWPAQESSDTAAQLQEVLAQGLAQQQAAQELAQRTGLQTAWTQQTVDTRQMGKEDQVYTQVVQLLSDCAQGQLAGPLYVDGKEVWLVPQNRQNEQIGSFEEAEPEIEDLWRTEYVEQEIEKKLQDIQLQPTKLHSKLTIDQLRGNISS